MHQQTRFPHQQPFVVDGRSFDRRIEVLLGDDVLSTYERQGGKELAPSDEEALDALSTSWFLSEDAPKVVEALADQGWDQISPWRTTGARMVEIDNDSDDPMQIEDAVQNMIFGCEIALRADAYAGKGLDYENTCRVMGSGVAADVPFQPTIVQEAVAAGGMLPWDWPWWGCTTESDYLAATAAFWRAEEAREPYDGESLSEFSVHDTELRERIAALTGKRLAVSSTDFTVQGDESRVVSIFGWCTRSSMYTMRAKRGALVYVDEGVRDTANLIDMNLPEWVTAPLSNAELNGAEIAHFGLGAVNARSGLNRFRAFHRLLKDESAESGIAFLVSHIEKYC